MRSAVAGIALGLLVIAALIAFVRYGMGPSQQSALQGAADPARIAAQVPLGFEGDRQIGAWKLSCGPEQQAPKTRGARPRTGKVSSEWKIPRCRVFAALSGSRNPDRGIRVTIRRAGLNRTLSLFVRFWPGDVRENDKASLRADKSIRVMAIRHCTQEFCLVRETIAKSDFSSILSAKSMSLAFTSRASGQHLVIAIPSTGLTDAIRAMLRIDR
jgi:invasion protein IalB